MDPEIQAFMDQKRAPTRSDMKGLNTNFQATVNRVGGDVVTHLNNLQAQLRGISNGGNLLNTNISTQGNTLNNIHNTMKSFRRKFDSLQTVSQSRRQGSPTGGGKSLSSPSSSRSRSRRRSVSPIGSMGSFPPITPQQQQTSRLGGRSTNIQHPLEEQQDPRLCQDLELQGILMSRGD